MEEEQCENLTDSEKLDHMKEWLDYTLVAGEIAVEDETPNQEVVGTFRKVDDDVLFSLISSLPEDPQPVPPLSLKGLEATELILSGRRTDCPSYIKMDAYIDEDLSLESCSNTDNGSSIDRQSPATFSICAPPSPVATFPFYSPQLIRRQQIQDLLPPKASSRLNLALFGSPGISKEPQTTEWRQLLHQWTDPCNPPRNLKLLLRSGCPKERRAHAWNLLIIRRTCHKRASFQYASAHAAGLEWANSAEGRASRAVQQMNTLMISTPGPALESQLRVRRVLLALHQTVGMSEFQFAQQMITAILPIFNQDEEAAFWALVALQDSILTPGYFLEYSKSAEYDGKLLWLLLEMFAPAVVRALTKTVGNDAKGLVVRATMIWRQSLLLGSFEESLVWRAWDALLFEGDRVIFRYQVAVLIMLQPLLECVETAEMTEQVVGMAGSLIRDVEAIATIVNETLNGITGKLICKLRRRLSQV